MFVRAIHPHGIYTYIKKTKDSGRLNGRAAFQNLLKIISYFRIQSDYALLA